MSSNRGQYLHALSEVAYSRPIITHCRVCGGDGGFAVPVDINRFHGGLIERWERCYACDDGEIEIETFPVTLEDHIDNPEGLPE
jgi:hypothetical protein